MKPRIYDPESPEFNLVFEDTLLSVVPEGSKCLGCENLANHAMGLTAEILAKKMSASDASTNIENSTFACKALASSCILSSKKKK